MLLTSFAIKAPRALLEEEEEDAEEGEAAAARPGASLLFSYPLGRVYRGQRAWAAIHSTPRTIDPLF